MTDAKSLALLEYPELRARLADHAAFAPSRRLAEALSPSADPVIVRRALDETDEARALLSERPGVGVGGARDIEPWVGRAARGGRLEPGNLLEVAATLESAARLVEVLGEERRPLLHDLGRQLVPLPALRVRIEQSVDPSGELLDSASPALGGLRRAVRVAYERLRSRLEQLVHGGEIGSALQEPIITLRNGRYVVPVRADARGRVKGIVHDQSGSGQTLFMEPLIAVELGNVWREAQLKVQVEEERILDELSALVGSQAPALRQTVEALARFDFWSTKARLAAELDGIRAQTSARPEVELLGARHPGLTGRVVPIDLRLGGDFSALVITGPNTGGKTVALRTLGLLALMHQSGLHVPAQPGTRLPIFPDVLADIGDEQSVAQSLSTFSGHLRSIVRIVETVAPGCLVLLDELGAGTDPTEGSALAQALLDHFIRAGALVVATTHYSELKTYAHNTTAARNASVEFDLETLSPTYRLSIGLPGTSQAFAIAERLGLPQRLVEDARSRLSRAQVEFEATLASIKDAQTQVAEAQDRTTQAEERARDAQRGAELERARARRERDDAFMSAREEADRALAGIREEIRAARQTLERETLTAVRLDAAMDRLDQRLAALPRAGLPGAVAPGESPAGPVPWQVGMHAGHASGWEGRIAAMDRDGTRATLEAGALRVAVDTSELVPLSGASGERLTAGAGPRAGDPPQSGRRGDYGAGEAQIVPAAPRPRVKSSPPGGATASGAVGGGTAGGRAIPSSLDVRGARAEEAVEVLEQYLDQASRAEAGRVTIIHGHGSGALRGAVRSLLRSHPLVQDWRPGDRTEGGDGATIVTL